jgi:hypothetical protein
LENILRQNGVEGGKRAKKKIASAFGLAMTAAQQSAASYPPSAAPAKDLNATHRVWKSF